MSVKVTEAAPSSERPQEQRLSGCTGVWIDLADGYLKQYAVTKNDGIRSAKSSPAPWKAEAETPSVRQSRIELIQTGCSFRRRRTPLTLR